MVVPDSVYTIQKAIGDRAETLLVKDATHYVYYDISQEAEEKLHITVACSPSHSAHCGIEIAGSP